MTALATAERTRELGRALGGSLDAFYALNGGNLWRAAGALAPLAIVTPPVPAGPARLWH